MRIGLNFFCVFSSVAAILLFSAPSNAQAVASSSTPAIASSTPRSQTPSGAYGFLYRFGASCGVGATTSPVATKPSLGCGVGANPLIFIYTEVGVMGPHANRSNFSGYLSNDFIWPLSLPGKTATRLLCGHPVGLIGYTRMFETGHALDYGIGFEHHVNNDHSLQFELRDYMTFANPTQHNIMFRAVWLLGVPD